MDMSADMSAGPLRACVKVDDCCDPFSTGTLTHIKMIEMCVESVFSTERMQSAIAGHFFCFSVDD
jgi:hypothetical protein